ncbi:MAG: amidohydrolase family protein [Calditrichaeota bacterium]|nr:amidohydrolase family protein [Calditrichota bacterium]
MIDFHTHFGRLVHKYPPLKVSTLLKRMDRLGIEQAVVMPIENPEETEYYVTTDEVLRATRRHADRLIPFCNIDPRRNSPGNFDPRPIIEEYVARGCVGFGEVLTGLQMGDPRMKQIYAICEEMKLPVVLHFDSYINIDEPGLPRFEQLVDEFPKLNFIAHAMCWWGEISKRVDYSILYPETGYAGYPTGSVVPGGRVEYLLDKYPNVYADLSANSGYNALTRDIDFSYKFLEKFSHKLLFATDYLYPRQPLPIVDFIKNAEISSEAFKRITETNAKKLLHRYFN